MAVVKVVFYIPVIDNDGRDLSAERGGVELDLFLGFDGWTKLGLVQGGYRMADGSTVVDEHYAYALVCDDARLPDVRDILRTFKARTTQEAVYLEIQPHVIMELI